MLRQYSDPIHGAVIIEDQLILDLIDTKEFNRLKKVNQLGMTHYIYPGATHNRFSHSLGTYEIARKVLNTLKIDMPVNSRLSILAACLLHDIGHGPMSHLFESVSPIHHEAYTIKLITDPKSEIKAILDKHPGMSDEIVSIINKTNPKAFA